MINFLSPMVVHDTISYAIAPALIAAIPAIVSMVKGFSQDAKANKLARDNNRPSYNPTKYEIPKEVNEYLARVKGQVSDKLPGQALMENKLDANTSNAIAAIQQSGNSSADIINAISGIANQQNDATNNLGIQGAQHYMDSQNNVNSALLNSAAYKDKAYQYNSQNNDKAFEVNQMAPYQQMAATISALRGAGQQNQYNGLNSLSQIGTMAAANSQNNGAGNQRIVNPDSQVPGRLNPIQQPQVTGPSIQSSPGQPINGTENLANPSWRYVPTNTIMPKMSAAGHAFPTTQATNPYPQQPIMGDGSWMINGGSKQDAMNSMTPAQLAYYKRLGLIQ